MIIASNPALARVQALLERVGLPVNDLSELDLRHFFYAGPAEQPVGLVGLQLAGTHALLRSLVVDPESRRSGLGSRLVAHAESYAHSRGVKSIYLLTTTAERFFAARGYARTERNEAPASIRATREFSAICPASSAFMVKRLAS